LKHAGTYSAEEIALITRDKLIQLQSLYAEYLNVLKRRYGRKRLEFHKRIKVEKETLGPLWASAVTPRHKMKLDQLAAWRRSHRHFGEEGLLHQQSQKRRRLAAGISNAQDNEPIQLCNALVNGMECGEVALPNSSMCARHILCDGKQVLFLKCEMDDCRNVCVPISDVKYCWFHQRTPESIRHEFNVPWASSNATNSSSSHQRSSVFASSAPPLRVFPPLSTNGGGGGSGSADNQTQAQSSGQKSRNSKKQSNVGSGIVQGRRESAPSLKKASIASTRGMQTPASDLRSAPPMPTKKHTSLDDMSAEAGVYGAYMANEGNEVAKRNPAQISTPAATLPAPEPEIDISTPTTSTST